MCKNNKNSSFFMISIVKLWQYVLQLDLKSYCCCLTWRICILTTSHVVRWKAVRLAAESKNEGIWMSTYRNDVPHPIRCHCHEDMCVTKKKAEWEKILTRMYESVPVRHILSLTYIENPKCGWHFFPPHIIVYSSQPLLMLLIDNLMCMHKYVST